MKLSKTTRSEILLFGLFFIFAAWLMWHTFQYRDHTLYISAKVWSDFAAHLPLIRSFSWGQNWPPEYPLFPGEPIRYHFLFYFLVGNLEKLGLPPDWALNLPSALGFGGLMIIIYLLGKLLFKSRLTGFLAVILFLFNSSLSSLEFFKSHSIKEIFTNTAFPCFGPWDGQIISAFWTLNIYTNQRHLAPAFFLALLIIYIILKNKKLAFPKILFLAILLGFLPFFHKTALIISGLVLFGLFLFFPKKRRNLFLLASFSFLLIAPQLYYQLTAAGGSISFHPGYLIEPPVTIGKFFTYWWANLGLSLFFIPLGFFFAPKTAKKLFLAISPVFWAGYLFQFSPELAANHKFFNFFVIIGNLFTANLLVRLWQKKLLGKLMTPVALIALTLSGLIDFFPIKNDVFYQIPDAPNNPDILWIKNHTSPDAVFLNSSFLYHSASLAGRKIFFGWPYFTWSAGYDTYPRDALVRQIWSTTNLQTLCSFLKNNHISFISFHLTDQDYPINQSPLSPFSPQSLLYRNPQTNFQIYAPNQICSN
jgi:hypothetical protein